MNTIAKAIIKRGAAAGAIAFALLASPSGGTAQERPLFIALGDVARPPIGWVEFCTEYEPECKTRASAPVDVVLSGRAWDELNRVNLWVNSHVKPMTDMDHWGVVERWNYPDDGYGDCEDYALQKRKMLMQEGWPREALLMTVVRDQHGDGHAILTVKTDKGEYILDNETNDVLLWSDTGYRFVKRQSQADPNVWIALGDTAPAPATASAR
jgi:predicted transglutaminase-like cysteine proteinase